MKFELESNRLILRVLNQKYALNVCEFYKKNYDYLALWEPNITRHFLLVDAMERFMKADMKNTLLGNSVRYWFSFKNSPDKLIGAVNFQSIKKGVFKSCQIGYKIDKEFSEEGLHRIEAIIATDNIPSIRLAEKLGFVREGINRECVSLNGQWKNCYQYSLLNGELKA